MTGLDTNILVRLLVQDDEAQHRAVIALFQRAKDAGEQFFVGDVVVAEVVWVLGSRYRLGRHDIVAVLQQLIEAKELVFESVDRIVRALRSFESQRGDLADYLIAERARDAGCGVIMTFDQALHTDGRFAKPAMASTS